MRPSVTLIAFLPLTGAFSWAHTSLWKSTSPRGLREIEDAPIPNELASVLQASDSLEKYSTKPDCFRRAASMIRSSCAELETHEDERIRAALSMTLCEIATAEHQSPPMECIPFQAGQDGQPPRYAGSSPGKCVEALSRSAQYWSSYSGYLREVPQLCFAFRRWNDIDLAKELHHNSTLQSLAVLRYIADRETTFEGNLNSSSALVENMHMVLNELHASSATINVASSGMSEQLRRTLDEISRAFRDSVVHTRREAAKEHSADLVKIESTITSVIQDLAVAASTIAPAIHEVLTESMDRVYSSMNIKLQDLNELSDQIGLQFVDFERDLEIMRHGMRLLIGDTQQASEALADGVRESIVAHEKQLAVAQATDDVVIALNGLVDKAHVEMQNINGTANAMKESLLKDISGGWSIMTWSWLEAGSVYFVKCFWNVDAFLDVPAFRVIFVFSRMLWSLLGLASSGLMSLLVLLASRRTLFARHRTEDYADGDSLSMFSGAHSSRVRYSSSLATSTSLGSDNAVLGPADALAPSAAATSRQRRPRVSRIPDRLCKPSGI